jgi:hypothetical protein
MNWSLEKACSLAVRSYDNKATVVKVCLIADVLDRFCLGLCLLKEDLIDSLDLVDTKGAKRFRLQRSTRAISIELQQDKINLALDAIELERWLHFTLRAVRDGVAEVDHLDVEAILAGQAPESVDLIIAYPSSVPPVSSNEARRRLGL